MRGKLQLRARRREPDPLPVQEVAVSVPSLVPHEVAPEEVAGKPQADSQNGGDPDDLLKIHRCDHPDRSGQGDPQNEPIAEPAMSEEDGQEEDDHAGSTDKGNHRLRNADASST